MIFISNCSRGLFTHRLPECPVFLRRSILGNLRSVVGAIIYFSIEPNGKDLFRQKFRNVRVFANGPGDVRSTPGRVKPKTLKWYLIPPCLTLSNIRYISRVKWSSPRKGIAPSPTPRCSSYRKGSLLVALDYGRQLYFYLHSFYQISCVSKYLD